MCVCVYVRGREEKVAIGEEREKKRSGKRNQRLCVVRESEREGERREGEEVGWVSGSGRSGSCGWKAGNRDGRTQFKLETERERDGEKDLTWTSSRLSLTDPARVRRRETRNSQEGMQEHDRK